MPKKVKKVPLRRCVITKEMKPKKELIRVVRNKEGEVFVDTTGKKNGRGAYLTLDPEVIKQAEKSRELDKNSAVKIPDAIYEELMDMIGRKSI